MAPDRLAPRALNRATLARQLLLRRHDMPAVVAVDHLVGLQAQAPWSPYFSLWSRLAGFDPQDLGAALVDRRVVRLVVMRGTIHLLTADDALTLRPLTQVIMDRDLRTNSAYARQLAGVDLAELARAARAAVEAEPLTGRQLGATLAASWPDHDRTALVYAARNLLPLVQLPPRAVWGRSGQPTLTTVECWLGRPLHEEPSLPMLALRYLAAFGPATAADFQTWSGLTRLRDVVERLRPQLRVFVAEDGRELFDLAAAPRPAPDTPAPPRFLPDYDNLLRSHADRERVIAGHHRRALATRNGVVPGTVLIDGAVGATWWIVRDKRSAVLHVAPFARVSRRDAASVVDEGARLLDFAAAGFERREVQLQAVR